MPMKRIIKKSNEPPLCQCNCGQRVERSKVTGKWNNYLHGHNSRSNNDSKFKPGNKCGKGRPEGSRNKVSIAAINFLKDEETALSRKAIELALNGNTQLLQFCMSRILPPPPKDIPIKLEGMPVCKDIQSSVNLSLYVLEKLADGSVTPTQATMISGVVEKHLRCLQLTDIEQRLSVIEESLRKHC
jgi:hypothetical protein